MSFLNLNLRKVKNLEERNKRLVERLKEKCNEVRMQRQVIEELEELLSNEKVKSNNLRFENYNLKQADK